MTIDQFKKWLKKEPLLKAASAAYLEGYLKEGKITPGRLGVWALGGLGGAALGSLAGKTWHEEFGQPDTDSSKAVKIGLVSGGLAGVGAGEVLYRVVAKARLAAEAKKQQTLDDLAATKKLREQMQSAGKTRALTREDRLLIGKIRQKGNIAYEEMLGSNFMYGSEQKAADALASAIQYRERSNEKFRQSLTAPITKYETPYQMGGPVAAQPPNTLAMTKIPRVLGEKIISTPEVSIREAPPSGELRATVAHEAVHTTQAGKWSPGASGWSLQPSELFEVYEGGNLDLDFTEIFNETQKRSGDMLHVAAPSYLLNDWELEARLTKLKQHAERSGIPIRTPEAAAEFLTALNMNPAHVNMSREVGEEANVDRDTLQLISVFNILKPQSKQLLFKKMVAKLPGLVFFDRTSRFRETT
jgi:hypothetical protein